MPELIKAVAELGWTCEMQQSVRASAQMHQVQQHACCCSFSRRRLLHPRAAPAGCRRRCRLRRCRSSWVAVTSWRCVAHTHHAVAARVRTCTHPAAVTACAPRAHSRM